MHALGQHVDRQRANQVAAQRSRAPELVVIAAFGIEANHEARRANAICKGLDVVRQVVAAAFLAGLDQYEAAGMRNAEGATPVPAPECTPSVSTSIDSVPTRFPRNEVVHHSWS